MAALDGVTPAIIGAANAAAGGYEIERSLRFNNADSSYLDRTPSSASNRRTWTWSGWVKRTELGTLRGVFCAGTGGSDYTSLYFQNDQLKLEDYTGAGIIATTAVYRDTAAWYHLVVSVDTTQATASDRVKFYINGVQQDTSGSWALNTDTRLNDSKVHRIGTVYPTGGTHSFNGYLAEIHFVDGQALAPTDFGESDADTGVWNPIQYSGSYGTNGYRLDFSDNTSTTTIGEDSSGNNNDWTATNFSVASGADNDSLIDTPTNYEAASGNNGGNYCILNPLDISGTSTVSDGGLEAYIAGGATNTVSGNFSVTSGKWYWEASITTAAVTCMIGVADGSQPAANRQWQFEGWYYYASNGNRYHASTANTYGSSYGQNDIIGVALDMDAGTLSFYKNGTSQGVAYSTGLSGLPIVPAVNNGGGSSTHTVVFNFGQRPFQYTPPTNHLSLCTQNLSDSTITDSLTAFDIATWTGDHDTSSGSNSSRTISLPGNLNADLVWIKRRSTSFSYLLNDVVRGFAVNKGLNSDTNASESSTSSDYTYGFVSGTADGEFTIQSGIVDSYANKLNETYVAWAWDAGTSTVTNTDGTHSAQVRANSSTGFSISTHSRTTAASISTWGHGLGVAPEFAMLKPYNGSYNWIVWHKSMGNRKRIYLNSTSAGNTYAFDVWSSDSTTLGVYGTIMAGGGTALDCVTYAWAPIEGYSRFGFYEGNGSTDGPFVSTGFRPAFVMIKNIDASGAWSILDTARDPYNLADNYLLADSSGAEGSPGYYRDYLSNGFKIRDNGSGVNNNGQTYIYAAFAEFPFKTARAR